MNVKISVDRDKHKHVERKTSVIVRGTTPQKVLWKPPILASHTHIHANVVYVYNARTNHTFNFFFVYWIKEKKGDKGWSTRYPFYETMTKNPKAHVTRCRNWSTRALRHHSTYTCVCFLFIWLHIYLCVCVLLLSTTFQPFYH